MGSDTWKIDISRDICSPTISRDGDRLLFLMKGEWKRLFCSESDVIKMVHWYNHKKDKCDKNTQVVCYMIYFNQGDWSSKIGIIFMLKWEAYNIQEHKVMIYQIWFRWVGETVAAGQGNCWALNVRKGAKGITIFSFRRIFF